MQVETIIGSPPSPVQLSKKKERQLLSAALKNEQNFKMPEYKEKTIYRSQKFGENENELSRSRNFDEMSRNSSSSAKLSKRNKEPKNQIDWNNLGEKIEDWFEHAKTPDQKVVYRFLSNLKEEEMTRNELSSAMSSADSSVSDKAQSLEDILEHLKKYRSKLNRKSRLNESRSALPTIRSKDNNSLLSHSQDNLKGSFESSTWRVMRHLKSADIRNKYPLPKANPDYHFRNATIFHTAGRPPKSTFLLHPDWV